MIRSPAPGNAPSLRPISRPLTKFKLSPARSQQPARKVPRKAAGVPGPLAKPKSHAAFPTKRVAAMGATPKTSLGDALRQVRKEMDRHAEAQVQGRAEDHGRQTRSLESAARSQLAATCAGHRPGLPRREGAAANPSSDAPSARVADLVLPTVAPGPRPVSSAALPSEQVPGHAEALMKLVERIDVFVKSQRPALALTLRGGFAKRVEVERSGPGQVTLRLEGGPGLSREDLARLRAAMTERGVGLARVEEA